MHKVLSAFVAFVVPVAAAALGEEPRSAGVTFFESKIRPVLVERCYQCHSAAALKQGKLEGKLLLDSRDAARKGGESGPAVVPGDPKASLLVTAIKHDDLEMPPDTKLPKNTIADFVKWVEMGAPDPRDAAPVTIAKEEIDIEAGRAFWSFQPLKAPAPPVVKNAQWVRTEVDRFILAPLERKAIEPNDEAQRRTLIRRAYFDLWGLPPEPAVVDKFAADKSPGAYEQLVDRLLAGPHYGERWARHWLDLARFAESNGYAFDKDRAAAFQYRDFVIQALNEDMPYDRFVRLQIAGDLLEPDNFIAHAATGFLAAGTFTSQQTQKERERSRYEQLDDVVGTIGTSMLGMTIGCARCHDHKFDPLPTHDYYRFTAAFAATGFQDFDYDPHPVATKAAKAKFAAEHKSFVDARLKYEKEQLPAKLDAWIASSREPPAEEKLGVWQHIGPFAAGDFKTAFNRAFAPEKGVDLTKPAGALKWTARPGWTDGRVHNTLAGVNSANYLYRTIEVPKKGSLVVSLGRDDAIKVFLNGKQVLAKETLGAAAADQDKLTLQFKPGKNELLLKIVNASGPSGFYFSARPTIPKNIQDILKLAADKRNDKQKQAVSKWYAPRDPQWASLNQAEQEHLKKQPQPKITKVFAARKNGATYNFGADTRKVYFLSRGNSNAKKGLAAPGFFRVLTAAGAQENQWLKIATANDATTPREPRVALADWMTDHKHGAGNLLSRVMVNRLWQHHTGRGLVATPSDFGSQGAAPTHPELLDYLAAQLIQNGWQLKPIHKLIMMSAVYRQSGETSQRRAQADPENRLWWRRGATRLEAEVIRDTLLAVSGSLDRKMLGKGSLDQANPRRSIYLTVKRSALVPILQLFDAPDSIQSIGNRDVTTVPPQALAMMNSAFVRQLAEKFARRIRPTAKTSLDEVVGQAYRIALSRPPRAAESSAMLGFIQTQAASYGDDESAIARAVADYCQLMFCLNEFVFVD